jgi:hypothetical protein
LIPLITASFSMLSSQYEPSMAVSGQSTKRVLGVICFSDNSMNRRTCSSKGMKFSVSANFSVYGSMLGCTTTNSTAGPFSW